eukprot:tig00000940_g5555.t1
MASSSKLERAKRGRAEAGEAEPYAGEGGEEAERAPLKRRKLKERAGAHATHARLEPRDPNRIRRSDPIRVLVLGASSGGGREADAKRISAERRNEAERRAYGAASESASCGRGPATRSAYWPNTGAAAAARGPRAPAAGGGGGPREATRRRRGNAEEAEGAGAGAPGPAEQPPAAVPERIWRDPYKTLVAPLLLNRTRGVQVRAVVWVLFERGAARARHPLGLYNKRARTLVRFAREFLTLPWTAPSQLHGVGKYAEDSWRIFCRGEWREARPEDHMLTHYHRWLWETRGGGGQPGASDREGGGGAGLEAGGGSESRA